MSTTTHTKKPLNVLWVSFEDTNPFYGCYGDTVARTPNVDRLAKEGVIYPKAFSTTGVCAPSRAAVITGMYPTSVGTQHMRTFHTNDETPELPTPYSAVIPHYVKCFSEYFRAAGYYCTNNVKTDYQFDVPRTAWDDCSETAHWRNRPDPDQPFFAVWNPTRSHESGMWEDKENTFNPDDMQVPPYFPDTPKVRESLGRMYTNIEAVDKIFGELLDQLEEDGLAENTIVVHWSDHGPMPRGKRWPYDSGLHVPMVIRWPGVIEAGTINEELVSTIDLGPSMMSACDLPIPPHIQGQAFLGAAAEAPRKFIYATRDRYDASYDKIRASRDSRYKYIRHYHPELPYLQWVPFRNKHPIMQEMYRGYQEGTLNEAQMVMFKPRPVEEFYDTDKDPWEINNLANDPAYAEEKKRLSQAVDDWIDEVGDMSDMTEEEMVRRWYPDMKQPTTAPALPITINAAGEHYGLEAKVAESYQGATDVALHCATQGASIAYRFGSADESAEDSAQAHWQLYSQPIRIPEGKHILFTRAIRIGHKESIESRYEYNISA